jgi:hypothetical protein
MALCKLLHLHLTTAARRMCELPSSGIRSRQYRYAFFDPSRTERSRMGTWTPSRLLHPSLSTNIFEACSSEGRPSLHRRHLTCRDAALQVPQLLAILSRRVPVPSPGGRLHWVQAPCHARTPSNPVWPCESPCPSSPRVWRPSHCHPAYFRTRSD